MRIRYGKANKRQRIPQVSSAAIVNAAPLRRGDSVVTIECRPIDFGWPPPGGAPGSSTAHPPGIQGLSQVLPKLAATLLSLALPPDSPRFMTDRHVGWKRNHEKRQDPE